VPNTANSKIRTKSRNFGGNILSHKFMLSLPVGSHIVLAAAHTHCRIVAGIDKRKRSNRIRTISPYRRNVVLAVCLCRMEKRRGKTN